MNIVAQLFSFAAGAALMLSWAAFDQSCPNAGRLFLGCGVLLGAGVAVINLGLVG